MPANPAYIAALRMLARRELSEAQVRERLARRGFETEAVDPAIERLLSERTLDDRRAAGAVARTEARVRRHGPRRIASRLMAMGIERHLARDVIQELFAETDESALLAETLDKRLRGNPARLRDPHERRKLTAYLVRQGFSSSAASALIRQRSREK